jgi:hypothetical protein
MKFIISFFLIISLKSLGQSDLLGKYVTEDEFIYFEFFEKNKFSFSFPSSPDCGVLNKLVGTYSIEEKQLILKVDYNYPEYEKDFNKQYFKSVAHKNDETDSIKIDIKVVDVSSDYLYPIPKARVKFDGKIFDTDYDGNLALSALKNKDYKLEISCENSLKIDTIINSNNYLKIEAGLRSDLMDLSKEYFIVYDIKKMDSNQLILKRVNPVSNKIVLKKQ